MLVKNPGKSINAIIKRKKKQGTSNMESMKRGRGRPRKEPVEGSAPVVKRPRGRPRKDVVPPEGVPIKVPTGRPTKYTQANIKMLLELLAHGDEPVVAVHKVGFTMATLRRWKDADPELSQMVDDAYEAGEAYLLDIVMRNAEKSTTDAKWLLEHVRGYTKQPKPAEQKHLHLHEHHIAEEVNEGALDIVNAIRSRIGNDNKVLEEHTTL